MHVSIFRSQSELASAFLYFKFHGRPQLVVCAFLARVLWTAGARLDRVRKKEKLGVVGEACLRSYKVGVPKYGCAHKPLETVHPPELN